MGIFTPDIIEQRRARAAQAFGSEADLILFGAGQPIGKPGGLDATYPYQPHPEYYWLTGERRPGSVLAWRPDDGWTHFVAPVTAEEALWVGGYDCPAGEDVAGLPAWVAARRPRAVAMLGSPCDDVEVDAALGAALRERLDGARRPKDASELELITRAVRATAAGHARAREVIRPGVSERTVAIEIQAAFLHHDADDLGYDTIVGAGAHAAVLHRAPGERVIEPDDVVLVDAGAALLGYTADVTRTFPARARFTPEQQAIHDIVLAAERAAIALCGPAIEWHDVHRAAATVLASGLIELGILRGSVEELLVNETIALFFPHGIGHLVGLGVRDVGGRAPGRPADRTCCGARVRVDLPLEAGFVMTVEPGIYFVPALLDDPERRRRHRYTVAWDALPRWRPVGGVRIEDDVLITPHGPEVLTGGIPQVGVTR